MSSRSFEGAFFLISSLPSFAKGDIVLSPDKGGKKMGKCGRTKSSGTRSKTGKNGT